MTGLVNALKAIASVCPLEDYTWDVPSDCPIVIPTGITNIYLKNVFLKENLHKIIREDRNLNCHYWAIQSWGGIGAFKKNEKNDIRIRKFIDELPKNKLTRGSFGCISSLSKVASFINSTEYAIYDSRAIYSLNWLLFNYEKSNELFPQPAGRNAEIAKYDLQTIFRLTKRPLIYKNNKVAFHQYCELLKKLAFEVFGDGSKPYKVEMLLFTAAPTNIIKEIESSVTVNIIPKI